MALVYFKPSFGPGGDGSQLLPYDATADHTQAANDELYLSRGETFNANLTITTNNISVYNYGSGAKPIINASTLNIGAVYGTGRSNILVDGLDLRGATTSPGAGALFYNGNNITVQNCDVSGNNWGIRIEVTNSTAYSGVNVFNNRITTTTLNDAIIVIWGLVSNGKFNNIKIRGNAIKGTLPGRGIFCSTRLTVAPIADADRAQNVSITDNFIDGALGIDSIVGKAWYGNCEVKRNTILNTGDGSSDTHVINLQVIDDCDAEDNHIDGATALTGGPAGSAVGIFIDVSCRRVRARRNYIKDCGMGGGAGSPQQGGSGVYILSSLDCEASGNLIIGCRNGITAQGAAATYYATDNAKIVNNTISGCTNTGIYLFGDADGTILQNNIIVNTPYGVYVQNGAGAPTNTTESHNLVFGYTTAFTTGAHSSSVVPTTSRSTPSNCLTVDPLLLSNFELAANSPCIGTGTNTGVHDYYDRPFSETGYDIGHTRASQGLIPTRFYQSTLSVSKLRMH